MLAATDAWGAPGRVDVPILRVMDRYARCGEARVRRGFFGGLGGSLGGGVPDVGAGRGLAAGDGPGGGGG